MASKTIYRADYRPPVFTVNTVNLQFDLYDDNTQVTNTMHVQRAQAGDLYLYGEDLTLVSIHLNGALLPHDALQYDDENLILSNCPDDMVLTIVTRIQPQLNTALSGLYRSNQLFCTQCEAEGFRRITYFPDKPDTLACYTTRITADKTTCPVLLSNGNLIESGESPDGRHWAVWHDPFKKPSYLFALVAGQLACVSDTFVTASGNLIDLKLYVEPGNENRCAHALASLKKAMRWDEEQFGREYDLRTYMIVAVSDFNMGAMENKGLNIFNSKYVLARPDSATDSDYADIEGIIAHEYFHNWTGNRITCRDWFQLSLKEGLTVYRDQEFSCDMNTRDVNRIQDVQALRNMQFPEDAGSLAHPVRPESYQEINNFYTATIYNKGAEVIRMIHTLLGKEGFRHGMDLYFQRHDGQAVTIDDFVAAMSDATNRDLTQFKRWYTQAGTPVVTVNQAFNKGQLTLTFTQTCPATNDTTAPKEPFHIPIRMALFNQHGQQLVLDNDVLELREHTQRVVFDNLSDQPIVSLLRGFSAPITLEQGLTESALLDLLHVETDGFAIWEAAQQLAINEIRTYIDKTPDEWRTPTALINVSEHRLEDRLMDPALSAELLMPPSFEAVTSRLNNLDISRIETARDFFRNALGQGLLPSLQRHYHALAAQETHQMDGTAYGRRRLKNTCLWFMMKVDETNQLATCIQQFKHAQTMTDSIASVGLLMHCEDTSARHMAIETFYQRWSTDDLVLDKWFALQATCELNGALGRVEALLSHPAFQWTNPNKVRALISTFCQLNRRHFHAVDGSGYAFLHDMLLRIDALNPQIAARLAQPFTRWQRLDKTRQTLMREQLEQLMKHRLSGDLHEMISKSLDAS